MSLPGKAKASARASLNRGLRACLVACTVDRVQRCCDLCLSSWTCCVRTAQLIVSALPASDGTITEVHMSTKRDRFAQTVPCVYGGHTQTCESKQLRVSVQRDAFQRPMGPPRLRSARHRGERSLRNGQIDFAIALPRDHMGSRTVIAWDRRYQAVACRLSALGVRRGGSVR